MTLSGGEKCLECLIFKDSCMSGIVLDARVYVNMEQIVPTPRLRENPTILWLPNIVISLVSIIYISFIHLFVHFLGEICMNWLGQM